MGRYSKTLSGLNEKVIVGTATYTDDATFSLFVDNAPDGEVGVFLDSGAVRSTALTAGLKFFIAQKRDGIVNKTPVLNFDDIFSKRRTAYDAPVKMVATLGYNAPTGTAGTGTIGFDFTGASATNTITAGISVSETTPGNQPFPIQEGYTTINSSTYDHYTALAAIVAQLNLDGDYSGYGPDKFVLAEVIANGARTTFPAAATVTQGSKTVTSTAHVLPVGTKVTFAGAVYSVATVVDANTFTLDRPYTGTSGVIAAGTGATQASSMAYTSGTTLLGVRLTAINFETHFKARGTDNIKAATFTVGTAWKLGAGSGTQIRELETEARSFDGVGSTQNAAFASDYGLPSFVSVTSSTYDQIFIDLAPKVLPSAAIPTGYEQKQIQRVHIAAVVGGTLNSTLQTIFAV
jgi:hypothetical protein